MRARHLSKLSSWLVGQQKDVSRHDTFLRKYWPSQDKRGSSWNRGPWFPRNKTKVSRNLFEWESWYRFAFKVVAKRATPIWSFQSKSVRFNLRHVNNCFAHLPLFNCWNPEWRYSLTKVVLIVTQVSGSGMLLGDEHKVASPVQQALGMPSQAANPGELPRFE